MRNGLKGNSEQNDISEQKIQKIEAKICDYFKVDKISNEIIKKAMELELEYQPELGFVPHAEKVLGTIYETGNIAQFQKLWYMEMCSFMQPKNLPEAWANFLNQ